MFLASEALLRYCNWCILFFSLSLFLLFSSLDYWVFSLWIFSGNCFTRMAILPKSSFVLGFVAGSIFISRSTDDSIAAILFVVTYLGLCLIGLFLVFTPSWQPFHLSHDSSSNVVLNMDGFRLQIFFYFYRLVSILWFQDFDCDHGWWQRSSIYSNNVKIKCVHMCARVWRGVW